MNAPSSRTRRSVFTWALLIAVTSLSWRLGDLRGDGTARSWMEAAASVTVIVLASVKIGIVLQEFMEMRHAPTMWRVIFGTWLVVTCVTMIALYLRGS